jgi:hypothetical protein
MCKYAEATNSRHSNAEMEPAYHFLYYLPSYCCLDADAIRPVICTSTIATAKSPNIQIEKAGAEGDFPF